MKLSKNQRAVMEHTIKEAGRNWFGTNYGCKDSDDFEILCKNGLAVSRKAADWMGDDVIYSVTEEGKKALKATP